MGVPPPPHWTDGGMPRHPPPLLTVWGAPIQLAGSTSHQLDGVPSLSAGREISLSLPISQMGVSPQLARLNSAPPPFHQQPDGGVPPPPPKCGQTDTSEQYLPHSFVCGR